MTIYIDSAITHEIECARKLGWVKGVTTNPTILARAGDHPEATLRWIAALSFDQVFYQLVSTSLEKMILEANMARQILGDKLVVKIPPTREAFQFVVQKNKEIPCCITAIFSPAQSVIACEAGARYLALYVNRATRLLGDGIGLVREISELILGYETEILAASVKSPEEAVAALKAGAHHLALPYDVLLAMPEHPLSAQTIAEFQEKGVGLF